MISLKIIEVTPDSVAEESLTSIGKGIWEGDRTVLVFLQKSTHCKCVLGTIDEHELTRIQLL